MDKETLSHYGWIVILVLILAVLLAMASPFGNFVADAIKSTTAGLFSVNQTALNAGGINIPGQEYPAEPAICGIEGHYIGDDRGEHGVAVDDCPNTHTYSCECNIWTVPEGCTYYIGVTSVKTGDYTGATAIFTAGQKLPCEYIPTTGDTFVDSDYEYRYNKGINRGDSAVYSLQWETKESQNGWGVHVLSTSQTSYGAIRESINEKPIVNMSCTFRSANITNENLKTINIPDTVTSMNYCFAHSGITDASGLVIPDSVTDLSMLFYYSLSLTIAPEIPDSAINISYAFHNCKALEVAPVIPSSVMYMSSTFEFCFNLKTYHGSTDPDGDFSNYIIPDKVTSLSKTFSGCRQFTVAPVIPNGVTNLSHAFSSCESLPTAPKIPSGVTNMEYTFYGCDALTTAPTIPTGVTNLQYAFGYTNTTTPPTIPNTVTNMKGTFYNCASLTTAPYIPNGVTDMSYTFYYCSELTKAPTIPKSVTNINYSFYMCRKLAGTITINSTPSTYEYCLSGTKEKITLAGSCTKTIKQKIANSYGNVSY